VLEGLKSGNVAESCRKYEIAPTLYYRWKGSGVLWTFGFLGILASWRRPQA
jgi:hypothetical protein